MSSASSSSPDWLMYRRDSGVPAGPIIRSEVRLDFTVEYSSTGMVTRPKDNVPDQTGRRPAGRLSALSAFRLRLRGICLLPFQAAFQRCTQVSQFGTLSWAPAPDGLAGLLAFDEVKDRKHTAELQSRGQ